MIIITQKAIMKYFMFWRKKNTIFVLTQFLDKNVPPTYLQFFLLLLKNQTINEMNIPPSSYFYELTDKKENNYWKKNTTIALL